MKDFQQVKHDGGALGEQQIAVYQCGHLVCGYLVRVIRDVVAVDDFDVL